MSKTGDLSKTFSENPSLSPTYFKLREAIQKGDVIGRNTQYIALSAILGEKSRAYQRDCQEFVKQNQAWCALKVRENQLLRQLRDKTPDVHGFITSEKVLIEKINELELEAGSGDYLDNMNASLTRKHEEIASINDGLKIIESEIKRTQSNQLDTTSQPLVRSNKYRCRECGKVYVTSYPLADINQLLCTCGFVGFTKVS